MRHEFNGWQISCIVPSLAELPRNTCPLIRPFRWKLCNLCPVCIILYDVYAAALYIIDVYWTPGSRCIYYINHIVHIPQLYWAPMCVCVCCSNTTQYQETPPAESIFFWQTAALRLLGCWTFPYRNDYGSTFSSKEKTMCFIARLSVWFISSYSFFDRYPNSDYVWIWCIVGKGFLHLMVKPSFFLFGEGRQEFNVDVMVPVLHGRQMSAVVGMSFARIEWKKAAGQVDLGAKIQDTFKKTCLF